MTNAIIASNAALMNPWRDLWNGYVSQAKFLDENLFTHVVLIGGSREELIRGREAWVTSASPWTISRQASIGLCRPVPLCAFHRSHPPGSRNGGRRTSPTLKATSSN